MSLISHVNLSVLPDVMEAEASFLLNVLDYKELDPGKESSAMGIRWFEFEDRSQVHLNLYSKEAEFQRGDALNHLALTIDDLELLRTRLRDAGIEPRNIDATSLNRVGLPVPPEGTKNLEGIYGFIVADPAGNLWELRAEYPYLGFLNR